MLFDLTLILANYNLTNKMRLLNKSILPPPKGSTAENVIAFIAKNNKNIRTFRFCIYNTIAGLDQRTLKMLKQDGKDFVARAFDFRKQYGFDFWDALLTLGMHEGFLPMKLVKQAAVHPTFENPNRIIKFTKDRVNETNLLKLLIKLNTNEALGLSSIVEISNNQIMHIPLVDFHCPPNKKNLKFVKAALKEIGEKDGIILNSGRSFHYYGFELKPEKEWKKFLGLCLLLSPLVDPRYVAHRLIDGESVLRIYSNSIKPNVPIVVDYLR
jgi:hypothetical protein